MTNIKGLLNDLGVALGTVLGKIFSPENLTIIGDHLQDFTKWLKTITDDPNFQKNLLAFADKLQEAGKTVYDFGKWFIVTLGSPGFQNSSKNF